MDLPVFRRGLELVSAQLNKLSQGIRAAQITSVIGGSFTRTPGGTTLVIGQQPGGGGAYCSFKCTDDTQPIGDELLISVQQDQINGRYPLGMDGEGGTFNVAIPQTWADDLTWVGIYIIIQVNEFGEIRPAANAIRVAASSRPLDGLENNQAFLLAEVTISKTPEGTPYISNIANACPLIQPLVNGLCAFQISDVFNQIDNPPAIEIRTGMIEARYPNGMTASDAYVVEIPDDGEWHAVYCVLLVDAGGNIQPGDTSISFGLYNDYQTNTTSVQYVLIGEVTTSYNGFGDRYISFIQNYCLVPAPKRSSTSFCKFQITNASTEFVAQVSISPAPVETGTGQRFPSGMGPDSGPFILATPSTGYILMAVLWDTETYNVATGESSITIFFSATAEENTTSIQYIILGTVLVADNVITGSYSVCSDPNLSPCALLV